MHSTSVPQGKALVERIFGTLQDRLVAEMRLEGVQTMDEANIFLQKFIEEYNNKFAIQLDDNKNSFRKVENKEKIPFYLSIVKNRIIDNAYCISYENKHYIPVNKNNKPKLFITGTKAIVVKDFYGNFFLNVHEKLYTLLEKDFFIKEKGKFMVEKETLAKLKNAGSFSPPEDHPYKKQSFNKYLSTVKHISEDDKNCII